MDDRIARHLEGARFLRLFILARLVNAGDFGLSGVALFVLGGPHVLGTRFQRRAHTDNPGLERIRGYRFLGAACAVRPTCGRGPGDRSSFVMTYVGAKWLAIVKVLV